MTDIKVGDKNYAVNSEGAEENCREEKNSQANMMTGIIYSGTVIEAIQNNKTEAFFKLPFFCNSWINYIGPWLVENFYLNRSFYLLHVNEKALPE